MKTVTLTEEDFNVVALARITEDFCASPMDCYDHLSDCVKYLTNQLPVQLDKAPGGEEFYRYVREFVDTTVASLDQLRDMLEPLRRMEAGL